VWPRAYAGADISSVCRLFFAEVDPCTKEMSLLESILFALTSRRIRTVCGRMQWAGGPAHMFVTVQQAVTVNLENSQLAELPGRRYHGSPHCQAGGAHAELQLEHRSSQ
jgi:hypothetical protein